jgi:hypothetical protein
MKSRAVHEAKRHEKAPHWAGLFKLDVLLGYRRVPVPVPVWSRVDPLGDVLISELPEGFEAPFGLPIAPGLT